MSLRTKLTDNFLKERCIKDLQYIQINDNYRPNYNQIALTPKFWSKYEAGDDVLVQQDLLNQLKYHKDMVLREKREWPETSNQIYGWLPGPVVKIDKSDRRFYFPRINTEITKFALNMMQSKKK